MTIPFVVSAASLCIVVFSFFYFRRYIARKTAARELLADYRAEVYRLIAEIDAAADRDSLLVEERIKTLKKLIDDTDRRIGVYMRELQRSRTGEAMYASLGRGIRAALDSRAAETPAAAEAPAPQPELFAPPAPALVKADAPQPPQHTPPQDAPQPDAPAASGKRGGKKPKVKVQIAEMAALGVPPPKIASRLKLSIAEVELALNLLHRNNVTTN
jgi:hypothetical protein